MLRLRSGGLLRSSLKSYSFLSKRQTPVITHVDRPSLPSRRGLHFAKDSYLWHIFTLLGVMIGGFFVGSQIIFWALWRGEGRDPSLAVPLPKEYHDLLAEARTRLSHAFPGSKAVKPS